MADAGEAEELADEGDNAGDGGRERVGRDGTDDGDAGLDLRDGGVGALGWLRAFDRIGVESDPILHFGIYTLLRKR